MRHLSMALVLVGFMIGPCWAQDQIQERPTMTWGNWVMISGDEYREFYPPVPVKGARWFSNSLGKCHIKAVVPNASLEPVPSPGWFSVEGIGNGPSMTGSDSMGWGRWGFIGGKWYREFYPPGPRLRGSRWFADQDGRCFSQPVVPEPALNPMDVPGWFSLQGMGTPPRAVVK